MGRPYTRRNAGKAFTNDSGIFIPTSTVSCAFTSAPASILGLPERYTDKNLQRATKLALKSFIKGQKHGQLQASSISCKQLLKAQFPNLY